MLPATACATAEVEPSESRTPKKTEMPLKAGLSEPGRYGNTMIAAAAKITVNEMSLRKVEEAIQNFR